MVALITRFLPVAICFLLNFATQRRYFEGPLRRGPSGSAGAVSGTGAAGINQLSEPALPQSTMP